MIDFFFSLSSISANSLIDGSLSLVNLDNSPISSLSLLYFFIVSTIGVNSAYSLFNFINFSVSKSI